MSSARSGGTDSESTQKPRKRVGFLLVNLGTPQRPEPKEVGVYLREFLMDKWVVDIPYVLRWILVQILIVPRRKFKSAEAYKTVWTDRGSPLLFHLKDLQTQVISTLKKIGGSTADSPVAIGMRYGQPTLRSGLRSLKESGVDEIVVFPLYPQYAESSTRSSFEKIKDESEELGIRDRVRFVVDYFQEPHFIAALVNQMRPMIDEHRPDHILFSFHGLPERHVKKTDESGQHCLNSSTCCETITQANRYCYRAQSYATARAVVAELNLGKTPWTVAFQSRLGRTPWIKPYTDEEYVRLANLGVKRLLVASPSFAADCLETLEEIAIRGREEFVQAGGSELVAVPCLNSNADWAQAVVKISLACLDANQRI